MTIDDALLKCGLSFPRGGKLACPLHPDDTPSLHLYAKTDSYYCFSCGANGDAYGLISLLLGVPISSVLQTHGEMPASTVRRTTPHSISQLVDTALIRMGDTIQEGLRGVTPQQAVVWWDRWQSLLDYTLDREAKGATQEQQLQVLERELARLVETIRQVDALKYRQEEENVIQHDELRSEVPNDGGYGGSRVHRGRADGEGYTVRVESTTHDDAADE